jgi:hypothetical protein
MVRGDVPDESPIHRKVKGFWNHASIGIHLLNMRGEGFLLQFGVPPTRIDSFDLQDSEFRRVQKKEPIWVPGHPCVAQFVFLVDQLSVVSWAAFGGP